MACKIEPRTKLIGQTALNFRPILLFIIPTSNRLGHMSDVLYISGPRALGDAIICNGLYRTLASMHEFCVLPIRKSLLPSYSHMYSDLNNIKFFTYPDPITRQAAFVSQFILGKMNTKILKIGFDGDDFPSEKSVRWDENYYLQAGLNFEFRWEKFYVPIRFEKEEFLYKSLGCDESPYVFLHEDESRGFKISRKYLPKDIRVITPDQRLGNFTIFDYRKIIKNAIEVHCIESSFTALIESMDLKTPKYAHRYSRPEAMISPWHEYTYRTPWKILRKN